MKHLIELQLKKDVMISIKTFTLENIVNDLLEIAEICCGYRVNDILICYLYKKYAFRLKISRA